MSLWNFAYYKFQTQIVRNIFHIFQNENKYPREKNQFYTKQTINTFYFILNIRLEAFSTENLKTECTYS